MDARREAEGAGHALKVSRDLDCAGHGVTGIGDPPSWYGIHLDPATGTEVRNCRVTGFKRGIRIRGGALRYGWTFPRYRRRPGRRPEDIV